MEILNILIIAVALSMDTFSLSLGLGTYNLAKKKMIQICILVGIMHFIMPFLGNFIGDKIVSFFELNSNIMLGIILLFIAANLLIDILKKEETVEFDFSLLSIFLFSFGVSIDAFSTGLGLNAITNNKITAMIVFSIISFLFTWGGLNIGAFATQKLGKKASIFGFLLLITIAISHICK